MEIQSIELSWQPSKGQPAILDRVSLTFETGGLYGIIGPNGSGKTSFLRHLLRFIRAENGQLMLGDRQLQEYERKQLAKEVSFVPQNTGIDTDFTAYDIVMMGRNPYRGSFSGINREDREKVKEAFCLASCEQLKEKRFADLSGGEAQRVLIARAIAQDTPWLLLDEPVSSLDVHHQMEIMKTLTYLNQEKKKSVIIVLHDLNLAARFCSHLVMLKKGRVVAEGKTKKLLEPALLEEVYDMEFVEVVHPVSGETFFLPK